MHSPSPSGIYCAIGNLEVIQVLGRKKREKAVKCLRRGLKGCVDLRTSETEKLSPTFSCYTEGISSEKGGD